jgi:dihydrofolate reductase
MESGAVTKVIWHITMSLDGFIAGPDHAMEWAFEDWGGSGAEADEIMRGTGAILGGRGWYDAAARKYDGVDGIYGGRWSGPVFVLTNRPDDAPDDAKVTFLSAGLGDGIRLYGTPPANTFRLERTGLSETGQLVSLRYAVER